MTGFLWRHSMSCQTTPSWNRITSSLLNSSQSFPELFSPTQVPVPKSIKISELQKQAWVLTSRHQTWDSLVLLMHSYPTSHVKTSQNLDKRFIFCLTGGEEMIHLAHYCGPGSANIRLESPCRSCWGLRCRPRLSRPASAPCYQAAPHQWPQCYSTHSSDISWIKRKSSWWKSKRFLTWVRGSSCRCPPSTSHSQWRAVDPLCHILCPDNQSIILSSSSDRSSTYLKLHFLPPVQM